MSFALSCGSLMTSCGPRTGANVKPLSASYQCAIGCAPKTSSRIATSSCPFAASFAGSENRGSVRRSGRPMAFATPASLSGVTARRNQVPSAARYTFVTARAGIACHRQQATAGPVCCEIEARQSGIGPLLAEAGEIRVDQPRIPLRDVGVFELQFLARRVRRVGHEHVGPLDELLENLLGARRLQVENDPALVAVCEMPLIRII